MFELMIFMILFFVGMVAVIWYLIVKIESATRQASEERAQLRVLLRAMESRMETISIAKSASETGENSTSASLETPRPSYDPLLRLNFDEPPTPEEDFARQKLELNLDLSDKK
ncbi:MAG: hypothetical protein HDQ93_06030 [Desulfovibrio sp.]|nr:hypothetical protein [Desulfovibrio sp.]